MYRREAGTLEHLALSFGVVGDLIGRRQGLDLTFGKPRSAGLGERAEWNAQR